MRWAFDWYQNRWPWMTLNSVMALFCVISANSGSFRAHCVKVHVRYLISWWVLVIQIGSLSSELYPSRERRQSGLENESNTRLKPSFEANNEVGFLDVVIVAVQVKHTQKPWKLLHGSCLSQITRATLVDVILPNFHVTSSSVQRICGSIRSISGHRTRSMSSGIGTMGSSGLMDPL